MRVINNMYDGSKTWVRMIGGDSDHFSIEIELHQRSALSPFLFSKVMNVLMLGIQYEVSWYILFTDDIILIDKTCSSVNYKLKVRRQTLETKGFKLTRTKSGYLDCNFCDDCMRKA